MGRPQGRWERQTSHMKHEGEVGCKGTDAYVGREQNRGGKRGQPSLDGEVGVFWEDSKHAVSSRACVQHADKAGFELLTGKGACLGRLDGFHNALHHR
mgnify:CR=1 FL=1